MEERENLLVCLPVGKLVSRGLVQHLLQASHAVLQHDIGGWSQGRKV